MPLWRNFRNFFEKKLFFFTTVTWFLSKLFKIRHRDSWDQGLSDVCKNCLSISSNKKVTPFWKSRMSRWNSFFFPKQPILKLRFSITAKYIWTQFSPTCVAYSFGNNNLKYLSDIFSSFEIAIKKKCRGHEIPPECSRVNCENWIRVVQFVLNCIWNHASLHIYFELWHDVCMCDDVTWNVWCVGCDLTCVGAMECCVWCLSRTRLDAKHSSIKLPSANSHTACEMWSTEVELLI